MNTKKRGEAHLACEPDADQAHDAGVVLHDRLAQIESLHVLARRPHRAEGHRGSEAPAEFPHPLLVEPN